MELVWLAGAYVEEPERDGFVLVELEADDIRREAQHWPQATADLFEVIGPAARSVAFDALWLSIAMNAACHKATQRRCCPEGDLLGGWVVDRADLGRYAAVPRYQVLSRAELLGLGVWRGVTGLRGDRPEPVH
jgi:hypothetical protein